MDFNWDFFPKWQVVLENGVVIPEERLLWKQLPKIIKEQNTKIKLVELDLGCGIIQPLPRVSSYYCAYRFAIDLTKKCKEEIKIIGWGEGPTEATFYSKDGTYWYEEIKDPIKPFLLQI